MAKYFVESPHTAEECLGALDEILAMGVNVLDQYYFGCLVGEHTGWLFVDADSESEAMEVVPVSLRSKARAVAVTRFTADQIEAAHEE